MPSHVEALFPYSAAEQNQISLYPHEKIEVLERDDSGWWIGRNSKGNVGIFPSTYVKELKTEKVFNKPKEMKAMPTATDSKPAAQQLSNAEKLARDLGFEDGDEDDEDEDLAGGDDQELQTAIVEIGELKNRIIVLQSERDLAIRRMQDTEAETKECRKTSDTARTQFTVLKKANLILHESERRLQQELEDMRSEFEESGKPTPEFKYEFTADGAIETYIKASTGALLAECEELKQKNKQLLEDMEARPTAPPVPPLPAQSSPKAEKELAKENGDAEEKGVVGGIDPEEYDRLRAKYKKLEREYKILRKDNKELKAKADEEGTTSPSSPQKADTPAGASADDMREATEATAAAKAAASKATKEAAESAKGMEQLQIDMAEMKAQLKQTKSELKQERQSAETAAGSTQSEVDEMKSKLKALDKKRKAEGAQLNEQMEKLTADLQSSQQEHTKLTSARANETNELEELKAENSKWQKRLDKAVQEKDKDMEEIIKKYKKEEKLRRQLFNELQELKGNIRVYCRYKPPSGGELEDGIAATTEDGLVTQIRDDASGKVHQFEFDASYGPKTGQEEIFNDVKPLSTSVLDGYNVCIFAYGQTGSGKTFTMEGPPDNPGVNYRTVQELFRLITEDRAADYETIIRISVIEVYNETVYDLLNKRSKVEPRFIEKQGVVIPNLEFAVCLSAAEVISTMQHGYDSRKTASTNMNEHSSRSHCLLSVYAETRNRMTNVTTHGKLHLVDLAGSERLQRTGATGKERVDEAKNINTSLTHLGIVINSLANKRDHIPYRNSSLTKLLQDSLGGNCKCLMFANISMIQSNASETVSTLKFAAGARSVELGKSEANKGKKSG